MRLMSCYLLLTLSAGLYAQTAKQNSQTAGQSKQTQQQRQVQTPARQSPQTQPQKQTQTPIVFQEDWEVIPKGFKGDDIVAITAPLTRLKGEYESTNDYNATLKRFVESNEKFVFVIEPVLIEMYSSSSLYYGNSENPDQTFFSKYDPDLEQYDIKIIARNGIVNRFPDIRVNIFKMPDRRYEKEYVSDFGSLYWGRDSKKVFDQLLNRFHFSGHLRNIPFEKNGIPTGWASVLQTYFSMLEGVYSIRVDDFVTKDRSNYRNMQETVLQTAYHVSPVVARIYKDKIKALLIGKIISKLNTTYKVNYDSTRVESNTYYDSDHSGHYLNAKLEAIWIYEEVTGKVIEKIKF